MRILSYNIHKGFSTGNRRFVLESMRDALRSINPDVVFLQEVIGKHAGHARRQNAWPKTSQFEYLADTIWPHHAYGRNAISSVGHHGNALLSKHNFLSWENIDVSTNPFERRGLLHGIINAEQEIHVICVHLNLLPNSRKAQIGRLCERISHSVPPRSLLIIAGDFNDWQESSCRQLESELKVTEAYKSIHGKYARTFPCRWPLLRLDRIYVRGFQVLSAACLNNHPWRDLSDHAALVTELIPS